MNSLCKAFIVFSVASVFLLCLCVENKQPVKEKPAATTAEEKPPVTSPSDEPSATINTLSDIQTEACNTAQEQGTCDKLKDLDMVVTVEECCKNLNKCC